jgi:hypothetical protein
LRTYTDFEPSDIDIENNPLHKRLASALSVVILLSNMRMRAAYLIDRDPKEATEEIMTEAVMNFLNSISTSYDIVDKEARSAISEVESLLKPDPPTALD